ncbi:50S ribosomal subunit protein L21 [Gammaproteobacteria bacterium]
MYAVVMTGGKQYRVSEGDRLRIETLPVGEGESVALDKVLLVANGEQLTIGTPYVEGGKVTATITKHGRGDKVHILKFRRRKHYQKVTGHRQNYTEIKITGISTAAMAATAAVDTTLSTDSPTE